MNRVDDPMLLLPEEVFSIPKRDGEQQPMFVTLTELVHRRHAGRGMAPQTAWTSIPIAA